MKPDGQLNIQSESSEEEEEDEATQDRWDIMARGHSEREVLIPPQTASHRDPVCKDLPTDRYTSDIPV